MPGSDLFSKSIIEEIKRAEKAQIIQPVQVCQTNRENELVFFFKPELLDVEEDKKIENSLALVEQKFEEYDVSVNGAAIVPGSVLDHFEIMNRHYGFINQLSRQASMIIDEETKKKIFDQLGLANPEVYLVLGGHEFIHTFQTDTESLSAIWFAQQANKLRSGFYYIADTYQGQPIVLINGFHPSQLEHFTCKEHRIYLMLLHTDTDWQKMKFDLVGDTFPQNAKQSSIRGILYAEPGKFGQEEVGINTNGVHLSAGPFEAAFEVSNFFGDLIDLDPKETPPLAIQRSIDAGFSREDALDLLGNPNINNSDLFSETENLSTSTAVNLAKQLLLAGK